MLIFGLFCGLKLFKIKLIFWLFMVLRHSCFYCLL